MSQELKNTEGRDLEFEKHWGFDLGLDYRKEVDEYNRFNEERDQEGRRAFWLKHNGIIAFWMKFDYYNRLKRKGIL